MLEREFTLFPERGDQCRSALHRLESAAREVAEAGEVLWAQIGELVLLEVTPDVFNRVQFRGVTWQRLDLDCALEPFQVVLNQPAAMRAGSPSQITSSLRLIWCLSAVRNSITCGPLMLPLNKRK